MSGKHGTNLNPSGFLWAHRKVGLPHQTEIPWRLTHRNPQTRSVYDQVVDLFSNWAISDCSSTQHISLGGAISFIFPTLLGIVPGNGRDGDTMEK